MKLNLRCGECDKVKESEQFTEELEACEAEDVDPSIFTCKECIDEAY